MKFSLFVHMERVSAQDDERQLYEEMMELCRMADDYLCEIRMRGDSNVSFRMEDAMRSKREEIWAEDRRCRGW